MKQKFKAYIDERKVNILCEDFFELNKHFCALDPSLRKKYASKMFLLLKTNGKVSGLLFSFPPTNESPPLGGSIDEYQKCFNKLFQVKTMEKCYNSIKPRDGRQLSFILKKPV